LKRTSLAFAFAAGLLLAASPALAAFIFRAGDSVWVDGKRYTWEEWKRIRDDPEFVRQSQEAEAAKPAAPVTGPRAAACTTAIYYDEFPSEDERFQCSAGLGALTREQILEKGWKVDFVEKIPPPPGQTAQSPRGLPLSLYKLVISRSSDPAPPVPSAQVPARPSATPRAIDTLCLNDCLGSGASKGFCEDRCTR
jgi:hypothetical protein